MVYQTHSPEVVEQVQKLASQGFSTRVIAAKLGLAQSTAARFARKVPSVKAVNVARASFSDFQSAVEGSPNVPDQPPLATRSIDQLVQDALQDAGMVLRSERTSPSDKARARATILAYRAQKKEQHVETLNYDLLSDEDMATLKALVDKCRG